MPKEILKFFLDSKEVGTLINGLFFVVNARYSKSDLLNSTPMKTIAKITIPELFAKPLAEIVTVASSGQDRDKTLDTLLSLFVVIGFLYSMDFWVKSEYKDNFKHELFGELTKGENQT